MPEPKRRKVEAEENGLNPASFGSGGSGILGQYIKDRREEAAQNPALQRVDTVDLTANGKSRIRIIPKAHVG